MIISIDGPAGSGKSTVAEEVSKKLNFIHFNSGTLYRAVCCYLLDINFDINQIKPDDQMPHFTLKIEYKNNQQIVLVNGKDYSARFRDNLISILCPIVSTNKFVRAVVDKAQRNFAKKHNLVVDGRDIGSFVFPNAEFKFYLDCSLNERALRRFKEEKLKNPNITLKEIKAQLKARDEIDKHKLYAPLVVPNGAVIIDSTNLTIAQVVKKILQIVKI